MKEIYTLNFAYLKCTGDIEYWDESDSAIDEDFTQKESAESPTPNRGWASQESQDEGLSKDERSLIWWVVAFTCVFETLHTLSSRAVAWLLHFLSSLFFFLGQYSNEIANIAHAFPSTLHQRSNYMYHLFLHCSLYFCVLIFIAFVRNGAKGLKTCNHICRMCMMGDYGQILCSLMVKPS